MATLPVHVHLAGRPAFPATLASEHSVGLAAPGFGGDPVLLLDPAGLDGPGPRGLRRPDPTPWGVPVGSLTLTPAARGPEATPDGLALLAAWERLAREARERDGLPCLAEGWATTGGWWPNAGRVDEGAPGRDLRGELVALASPPAAPVERRPASVRRVDGDVECGTAWVWPDRSAVYVCGDGWWEVARAGILTTGEILTLGWRDERDGPATGGGRGIVRTPEAVR